MVSALFARERTGMGQKIETSQTGATLSYQKWTYQNATFFGQADDGLPPWGHHHMQQKRKCADGKWIALQLMRVPMLERFCHQVIKRPELLTEKVLKTWPGLGAGTDPSLAKWI